ncbi:MAG: hypothetical protein ACSHWZ_06120 [Sulfitobacter sp.]
MPRYEYKVVPAPQKGLKGKGVKGAEARFSFALQELMNGLSGYGWEYLRAETLPSVERSGLTGSTTEWRNVLVFRRPRTGEAEAFAPELLPAPDPAELNDQPEDPAMHEDAKKPKAPEPGFDNGVEDVGTMANIGQSLAQLAAHRKPKPPTTTPDD